MITVFVILLSVALGVSAIFSGIATYKTLQDRDTEAGIVGIIITTVLVVGAT